MTLDALANILFPSQCSVCDTWDQNWLCASCESKLNCLSPSERNNLHSYTGVRALTQYSGVVKDILHRSKYEDQPWRLVRFAAAVMDRIDDRSWLDEIGFIVPMPGDPWRTWKRGFNPARLIAREIARSANIPLVSTNAFTRSGSKSQQALSMQERSSRYDAEVFKVNPVHLKGLTGSTCLLVDDIGTTGATIRAASNALAAYGLKVDAIVLSIGL